MMASDTMIVGSDQNGRALLDLLIEHLKSKNIQVIDLGSKPGEQVDYPDIAEKVALEMLQKKSDRGLLICGTGIGMAIAANKIPGIRAACCHDAYSASRAKKSNNAQIITMGAQVIGPELAKDLLDIWLAAEFSGGRSTSKVEKLVKLDEIYRSKA
jgi:ribose 5-phosphate isomerase B